MKPSLFKCASFIHQQLANDTKSIEHSEQGCGLGDINMTKHIKQTTFFNIWMSSIVLIHPLKGGRGFAIS
jgi:hypothetical protein